METIYQFWQNLRREDHLALGFVMALVVAGLAYMLLNAITFQYNGNQYLSLSWLCIAPLLVFIWVASIRLAEKAPNTAFLLKSYSLYFLAFFAFLVMLDGIQYTPFPPVDHYLIAADHALFVNETRIIDWTYAHPHLLKILNIAYHSVLLQLILIPLVLFIFGEKSLFHTYLLISLVGYIIGALIYYFFPSVGPAGILSDRHFSPIQLLRVLEYKEIHQYLSITTFPGGIIALPSFHVMWSTIMIYSLRKIPMWLFSPLLLLNIAAIAGTLFLGWDYAVDVIGGILLAWLAIVIGERLVLNKH